jgi:hypothetical protein
MSVFDKVKGELNRFKEERERNQAIKLNKDLASSKKAYANAKIKEEVTKNREYARNVNAKAREQRFAGFRALGQKIGQRTNSRATKSKKGRAVNLGGSPGSTGSIFTASSNSPNNIYFKGSNAGGGTNSIYHGLGNSPVQQKEKKKSIIIRL